MEHPRIGLTLVVQRPPCGSCQVIEQLTRESLERVARANRGIELCYREIHHPRELHGVPGLEIERLPALLVNGEQVSAGRVLTTRDIEEYISEFTE